MAPKKLKVEIPDPSPEIAEILEKLKVKEGVILQEPRKVSDRGEILNRKSETEYQYSKAKGTIFQTQTECSR